MVHIPLFQVPKIGSRSIVTSLAPAEDQKDEEIYGGYQNNRDKGRDHALNLQNWSVYHP